MQDHRDLNGPRQPARGQDRRIARQSYRGSPGGGLNRGKRFPRDRPGGRGPRLPVPGRAARALAAWLAEAGLTEGACLFRPLSWHGRAGASLADRSVTEIVKPRAALLALLLFLGREHAVALGAALVAVPIINERLCACSDLAKRPEEGA
jgi:hypothetical protein